MPLQLNETISRTETIASIKITSFLFDLTAQELTIAYNEVDGNGVVLNDRVVTIIGDAFTTVINNASQLAGTNIYNPLKQALYKAIEGEQVLSGTVI